MDLLTADENNLVNMAFFAGHRVRYRALVQAHYFIIEESSRRQPLIPRKSLQTLPMQERPAG